MFRTLSLSITFLASLSAFADADIVLPQLREKSNPDALLFYENALELAHQMTEDEARFRDSVTREVASGQELSRARTLRQKGANTQEELDTLEAEHAVAVENTKVADAYWQLRKHEFAVTLIQEKHHAGEEIDFNELKNGYLKRWKMRQGIAQLSLKKAEADMKLHDARLARHKKLHGQHATSLSELEAIKAERYIALHAKKAAEKRLEFYSKVFEVFR